MFFSYKRCAKIAHDAASKAPNFDKNSSQHKNAAFRIFATFSCDAPYLREPVADEAEYAVTKRCLSLRSGVLKVQMQVAEVCGRFHAYRKQNL